MRAASKERASKESGAAQWVKELVGGVMATEGGSEAWASAATRRLAACFPAVPPAEASVVGPALEEFLREAPQPAASSVALAQQVWRELKVCDGVVRASFAAHVRVPTRRAAEATPIGSSPLQGRGPEQPDPLSLYEQLARGQLQLQEQVAAGARALTELRAEISTSGKREAAGRDEDRCGSRGGGSSDGRGERPRGQPRAGVRSLLERLGAFEATVHRDCTDAGGAASESDESDGEEEARAAEPGRGRGQGRRARSDLQAAVAAIAATTGRDGREAVLQFARDVRAYDDWPHVGDAEERVAPVVMAKVFRKGNAEDWARGWSATTEGVSPTVAQLVLRYALILDASLWDAAHVPGYNPMNSPAVEVVCRDLYGLIKAHDSGLRRTKKGKVGPPAWALRDQYDVAAMASTDIVATAADERAMARVKARQRMEKVVGLAEKGASATDEA